MLTKYAVLDVLDVEMAPTSRRGLRRFAHKWNFDYEPRPGYLYVRSRAISSRCNDNFDEFPAEEIEKAYLSFIGKPVFVNHRNDNHRRARGVCIDAALHRDTNPDGSPDTWAEVLMEIDAVRFPKLAQAIVAGHIDKTSMGTDVKYSICSFCGNKASTPLEYCKHIPRLKGKKIKRTTGGKSEDVLVREICYGLGFFENSLLVEDPADPTALTLGVDLGPGLQISAASNGTLSTNQNWNGNAATFSTPSVHINPTELSRVAGKAAVAARKDNVHWTVYDDDPAATQRSYEAFVRRANPPREAEQIMARSRKRAVNDIVAPAEVDTLREDTCPVCGEKDTFDGNKCRVCGFIKPPDMFMDPDLEVAQQTDLRQDNQELLDQQTGEGGPGDLVCDNCGDSFESGVSEPELTTQPGAEGFESDEDEGVQDAAEITESPNKPPVMKQPNTLPKPKKKPPQEDGPSTPDGKPLDQKSPEDKTPTDTKPKDGDTCPTCGKGTLHVVNQTLDPSTLHIEEVPDEEDDSKDQDEAKTGDDKDGKGKSKPPWLKDKKSSSLSHPARGRLRHEADRRSGVGMRPTLEALAAQQRQLNKIEAGLTFLFELAGVQEHPKVAAFFAKEATTKVADEENPAQPIPEPGAEAPAQTTQEALAPDGKDDVESIGASPVAATAPDATTSVDATGTVLDEPLNLNEEDVTKPVEGTTEPRPLSETKTETDVRVGDPNNPQVGFPLEGPFKEKATTGAAQEARSFAALRLARLRIAAGIEDGDDLTLATTIGSSEMTDEAIATEIETLGKVAKAASKRDRARPVSRGLVPRAAAVDRTERTVPSIAEKPTLPLQTVASGPSDEEFLFD
jgi:hypothetical protein